MDFGFLADFQHTQFVQDLIDHDNAYGRTNPQNTNPPKKITRDPFKLSAI